MLALPYAVTGMCEGNTESGEDVSCSGGDGSSTANTQNKGSAQAGTDVATCCEAVTTATGKCHDVVCFPHHDL